MKKQNLIKIVLVGILLAGLGVASPVWADDSAQLKQQVQALQDRVDQLESQLANKQQVMQPTLMAPVAMPVYDQFDDPFRQMMLTQAQMERNMRQAFAGTNVFDPRMDMKQTDNKYIITMDIPGMDRDKINVEVKEGVLNISGERHSETEDKNNNQYYRQERSFGSFMQSIPLPGDARSDRIEAKYKNGVLTVSIARLKKEVKNPGSERIKVD